MLLEAELGVAVEVPAERHQLGASAAGALQEGGGVRGGLRGLVGSGGTAEP
jgi:hypothetical protein